MVTVSGMFGFVVAQVRGRLRRSMALLIAVMAATTGFEVLSGAAETSQLRTTGTVNANYRAAYDVLVRPNYLSGVFGGITTAQLKQVRAMRDVEVAAPIAMLGFSYATVEQSVDLTDQVDPSAVQQVFRLTPSWIADRGLTVIDDAPQYVYLSSNALYRQKIVVGLQPPGPTYPNGTALPRNPFIDCGYTVLEVSAAGRQTPLCAHAPIHDANGTTALERTRLMIWQRSPDGRYADVLALPRTTTNRLVVKVTWKVMMLSAAIDPPAEAKLVGLDQAMVGGRYLTAADRPVVRGTSHEKDGHDDRYLSLPTMIADQSYVDEQVQVGVERLAPSASAALVGREYTETLPLLARAPGTPVDTPARSSGQPDLGDTRAGLSVLYQPGVPTTGSTRRAGTDPIRCRRERTVGGSARKAAMTNLLPSRSTPGSGRYRRLATRAWAASSFRWQNPWAGSTPGVCAASHRWVRLILTNLAALDRVPLRNLTAPLSAVRVRVAGVTGMDAISQERVRRVAGEIATTTGLDVDITIGSSPSLQPVTLPAGKYGRPELLLTEKWSRKGVAVMILAAADRKSLLLSVLILAECAVFLGNAVAASVRSRRRELAVLACLGWPPGRLAVGLLGEVALVGLVGGLLAAAVSTPLAQLAGLAVPWWRAALAIPIGLGLALVAAAIPTLSAIRATPAEAVVPAVLPVRRSRHHRTAFGTAIANLGRVPARTLLGVLALTVGVAAVTLLAAVLVVYRNQVVGTLLGDAVTLQVRPVDLVATGATVLLGVVAVADVLYLNVRERAGEIAALWATGWTDSALLRLVVYEGLGIGAGGAIAGAALGLVGVGRFVGGITTGLVVVAALTAVAGTLLAGICAVVPALLLRRLGSSQAVWSH